jgi:hypothetical protein
VEHYPEPTPSVRKKPPKTFWKRVYDFKAAVEYIQNEPDKSRRDAIRREFVKWYDTEGKHEHAANKDFFKDLGLGTGKQLFHWRKL